MKLSSKIFKFVSSTIFLRLCFVWFVFQALFMSLSTRLGVSPDETYHYNFIRLFEKNGWLPFIHNQYGYYTLGEVKHTPFFLYHYLLSLPLHFVGGWHTVELLRLINIGLATWSLVLIVKLARRLKISSLVTNLSIFMLVNTLMFVFLSGSINYDNLLIPLSLLTFIFLFDFLDKPIFSNLLKLFLVCLAGSMTAINYLPILLGVFVIVIYKFIHLRKRKIVIDGLRSANKVLLVIAVLLSLLFLQRYGINAVRYHAISPSCLRFNTTAQCSQDGILTRAQTFPPIPNHPHPTPFEYFSDWGWTMRARMFGIFGHESIDENKLIRYWSEIIFILGSLAVIRYYRPTRNWNIIISLGLFYTLILFAKIYHGYYQTGYTFGLQGRYLFIFLPFLFLLFNEFLIRFFRYKSLQASYIVISLLIFMISALPTYILKTDSSWYKSVRATRVNNDLRRVEQKLRGR